MAYRLAADVTVAVHLAFVVFVLAGGFVAWRRPRVLRLHVPAVAVSAVLAARGLDCPLTDVEKWLRRRAGNPVYDSGFIAHYLVEPVYPPGTTPNVRVGLRVFTIAVVATAYLVLIWRRRRPPAREDGHPQRRSYAP
ncbi:MAG: DUF2784 domain-containing protein [Actinomycetota bacterium]|nr:DUF2784 domain-containing protein [Actinomycetota bacterium]